MTALNTPYHSASIKKNNKKNHEQKSPWIDLEIDLKMF